MVCTIYRLWAVNNLQNAGAPLPETKIDNAELTVQMISFIKLLCDTLLPLMSLSIISMKLIIFKMIANVDNPVSQNVMLSVFWGEYNCIEQNPPTPKSVSLHLLL